MNRWSDNLTKPEHGSEHNTQPPVLFLIFNRPETTRESFQAIAQAKPNRLYIAADGPRPDKDGESQRCEQARQIATAVDWPCEVKTLFRAHNLGCKRAVSSAIDWFFQHEPEGIILEDDCVASPDFFRFAAELLARYRHDERIMCISAQHFHGDAHQPEHSYFFSRYNHCWGWASWRRAWQHYDPEIANWPEFRDTSWLRTVGDGSRMFAYHWRTIFNQCYDGEIDTWDYQWTFHCWQQDGLTILPAKNLVANIGFGSHAAHTCPEHDPGLTVESLAFPLSHPPCPIRDKAADRWTDKYHFRIHCASISRLWIRHNMPGGDTLLAWLRTVKRTLSPGAIP